MFYNADMPAPKKQYEQYLQSRHWLDFSDLLYSLFKYQCVHCHDTHRLHKHHYTYKHRGNERIYEVCYLCKNCHARLHKGNWLVRFSVWRHCTYVKFLYYFYMVIFVFSLLFFLFFIVDIIGIWQRLSA